MIDFLRRCRAFAAAVARFAGRRGAVAALFVGLGALVEGLGILLLVPLLAILFGSDAGGGSALAALAGRFAPGLAPVPRLTLILASFAALMAVRAFILWRRDTILGGLQVGFVEALRAAIARRLAAARWPMLARIGHGRITHLMSGDIQRCGAGVHFLLQSGVAVVMLVAQAILAVALAPLLAAVALGLMLIGALAMFGLLRRSSDVGKMVTAANLSLMIALGRFLGGMKLAMSQNLQSGFVAGFERELAASARLQTDFIAQQGLLRGLWGLMAACVAGATVLAGFALLHLPAPVLLALLVLLARVAGPATQIQIGLQQIAYSLPAWEAVAALDGELAAAASSPPGPAGPPLTGAIELDEVVYRHEGAEAAGEAGLLGLSLRLEPGELVGVKGASGAGKTTLADLIAGLLTPQSGRVAIGGVALTEENAARWRERVAYVAQDPVLFNETVRHNLLWANPAADDAAIAAALAVAGAAALVERLPRGLETVVGERGGLVSGGERQKLALARALLRGPDILILDEATSAIDAAGEQEILARLRALDPRPAILVIAHRGESLAWCDRLVILAEGRLAGDERREARA